MLDVVHSKRIFELYLPSVDPVIWGVISDRLSEDEIFETLRTIKISCTDSNRFEIEVLMLPYTCKFMQTITTGLQKMLMNVS